MGQLSKAITALTEEAPSSHCHVCTVLAFFYGEDVQHIHQYCQGSQRMFSYSSLIPSSLGNIEHVQHEAHTSSMLFILTQWTRC